MTLLPGLDVTVRWLARGACLLAFVALSCAGYSAMTSIRANAAANAHQLEIATMRARSAAHDSIARDRAVRGSALAYGAASQEKLRHRSDSLATSALSELRARPALDTTDAVALRKRVHELEAVLALHVDAVEASRPVAPMYESAVAEYQAAIDTSMIATHESQRADTLSEILGEERTRAAHWRGVKQGAGGVLVAAIVVKAAATLLHLLNGR